MRANARAAAVREAKLKKLQELVDAAVGGGDGDGDGGGGGGGDG
jgi:hypothetical protein